MQKLLTDIGKKSKKAINKKLSTKKKDTWCTFEFKF